MDCNRRNNGGNLSGVRGSHFMADIGLHGRTAVTGVPADPMMNGTGADCFESSGW
jgi:hypothetical protein